MQDFDLKNVKKKIIRLYIYAGIVVLLVHTSETAYVANQPWSKVLTLHFPVQFLLITLATIINFLYTKKKLYPSFQALQFNGSISKDIKDQLFYDVIEFPQKFFWMTLKLFPPITGLKYIYELCFVIPFSLSNVIYVLFKFISGASSVFMYAITITIFLKSYLTPLLASFNKRTLELTNTLTFKKSMSMAGIFLFLIYLANIFVFEHYGNNSKNVLGNLMMLTIITFLIYIGFLRVIIFGHVNQLNTVSTALQGIQRYVHGEIHNHIPITTTDEVGVLTSSYNMVQSKIKHMYQEIDEDLRFAKNVHNLLMPSLNFQDNFLEMQAISKPAKDIGGDFYDYIPIHDKKYAILIGDVLGKGLPAALLMSMIIGHFHAKVQSDSTAKQLAEDLNKRLHSISGNSMFVTCGIGILDFEQRIFSYVSAGHLPPLIVKNNDGLFLESSSFPLGVSENMKLTEIRLPLTDINQIILYTDGIIEQVNEQGEPFGFDRLRSLFSGSMSNPEFILETVQNFASGSEVQDDMSVFIIAFPKP